MLIEIAEKLAPHLEDDQLIVLNPGRTGGALEFRKVLKDKGCRKKVFIAEAQTFIFASRCSNPGVVRIFRKRMRFQYPAFLQRIIQYYRKH